MSKLDLLDKHLEVFKEVPANIITPARKHNHYFKHVEHLQTVDVYRVLQLFAVTDQAIGHAVKKLLVAGGRGAGKDIAKDIQEAIDTLVRWQEMRKEDEAPSVD
jgi:Tfp pilus assembly PilM family ATPase